MPLNLEEAIGVLESFLADQRNADYLEDAIEAVIAAHSVKGLEMATDALYLTSEHSYLKSLWKVVQSQTAGLKVKTEAMRAISATLISNDVALKAIQKGEKTQTQPVLTRQQIDAEVERLMTFYRQQDRRPELRQLALEVAACVAATEAIRQAGQQALASEDPAWVATGAFVMRCAQGAAALGILSPYLEHPDKGVRFEVLQALAEVGGEAEYEMLEDLVLDGSGEPQNTAMWALSKVDREQAGQILADAARWFDGELGIQANAAYIHWCENWPARSTDKSREPTRQIKLPERLRIDGVYFRRETFSERIITD